MDKTMKQIAYICVMALLLLQLPADAQVWCPAGATWHYGFDYGQSNGYNEYTYMGDTVIAGVAQQQIAVETHYYTQNPSGYHEYAGETVHTRLDDGVLYIFQASLGLWDTLIWYSAVPGNQWQVLQPSDSFCDCRYIVTDTGHAVIGGMSLRYVQTTVTGFECESVSRRFLERIGSVHGTFLDECQTGDADTTLRCYQDIDMNYSPPDAPACDFISGIREESLLHGIEVWPNPGTDVLHVETGMNGKVDVGVHDATGRAVLTASAPGGSLEISSAGLSPGIYFIEVNTAEGRQTVKWVKR
jgi:hypothetical protein